MSSSRLLFGLLPHLYFLHLMRWWVQLFCLFQLGIWSHVNFILDHVFPWWLRFHRLLLVNILKVVLLSHCLFGTVEVYHFIQWDWLCNIFFYLRHGTQFWVLHLFIIFGALSLEELRWRLTWWFWNEGVTADCDSMLWVNFVYFLYVSWGLPLWSPWLTLKADEIMPILNYLTYIIKAFRIMYLDVFRVRHYANIFWLYGFEELRWSSS